MTSRTGSLMVILKPSLPILNSLRLFFALSYSEKNILKYFFFSYRFISNLLFIFVTIMVILKIRRKKIMYFNVFKTFNISNSSTQDFSS